MQITKQNNFSFIAILIVVCSLLNITNATAAIKHHFSVGETIFVAFPSGNIKEDAFIVGVIKGIKKNGDYVIDVQDYEEGHDYGSSCVPMIKKEDPEAMALGYGAGWEVWKDTTKLDKNLHYIVPKEMAMKLGTGKQYFVERNNLYIVFGRWESDAPVMTLDRIARAQSEAIAAGLKAMVPVFDLVKYHRKMFYDTNNRPLYANERIVPAIKALEEVQTIFAKHPKTYHFWKAKKRDWPEISKSTYDYFMIRAVDKILEDASDQLYEEGIEDAGIKNVERLKQLAQQIKRDK